MEAQRETELTISTVLYSSKGKASSFVEARNVENVVIGLARNMPRTGTDTTGESLDPRSGPAPGKYKDIECT